MKKLLKGLVNKVFLAFEYRDVCGVKVVEIMEYTNKFTGCKCYETVEVATGNVHKFDDLQSARVCASAITIAINNALR